MSPSDAAAALLRHLAAPTGHVTVWPVSRGGKTVLVVRIQDSVRLHDMAIPDAFEGFDVWVERGGPVVAQGPVARVIA